MHPNIEQLKILIEEYEEIDRELSYMRNNWDEYDDPSCDPGLQYELEMKREEAYNNIVEFTKTF